MGILFIGACIPDSAVPISVPDVLKNFVDIEWRCIERAGLHFGVCYAALRFTSANEVEGWRLVLDKPASKRLFKVSYFVNGKTTTMGDGGGNFTVTLNDNNGLLANIDGEGKCVYIKQ